MQIEDHCHLERRSETKLYDKSTLHKNQESTPIIESETVNTTTRAHMIMPAWVYLGHIPHSPQFPSDERHLAFIEDSQFLRNIRST